ncbi:MAG: hypothetical protein J3Q66DRAFT_332295 [Benniella sp.]|nr:MAG: hypothetical protein J3Q66DRAFT_332295 [Benniella sp.]
MTKKTRLKKDTGDPAIFEGTLAIRQSSPASTMNELQKKYLRVTRDGDISLNMWAHLVEQTVPNEIDKLWTSCGPSFLLTLGEKGRRACSRLCKFTIDERMAIWAIVKESKDHQYTMRNKASHQVQIAADDVAAEMASISALKRKLLEDDSDATNPTRSRTWTLPHQPQRTISNNSNISHPVVKKVTQQLPFPPEPSPLPHHHYQARNHR